MLRRGVMCTPEHVTPSGYDMQFGTNVLGTFYFTQLLIPALLRGAASSPDKHARIVTTASAYAYIGQIRFDTFKDGPARRRWNMEELYSQSKLGAILVAFERARRYGDKGIISVALHPGILRTDMMTKAKGLRYRILVRRASVSKCVHTESRLGAPGTYPKSNSYGGDYSPVRWHNA